MNNKFSGSPTFFSVLLLIALVCAKASAQPDTLWSARITATGNPAIYGAINHSSGDFILVGETNPALASSNFLIARVNQVGSVVWSRTFGSSLSDAAFGCAELPDGSLVAAGCSGTNTALIMGISAAGDSMWSRSYSSGGATCLSDITLLSDGRIAAIGYAVGIGGVNSDLLLLKYDPVGDVLETQTFGEGATDFGYRIIERDDHSLLLAGSTRSFGAHDYDFWLVRTDTSGGIVTSDIYGSNLPETCYALAIGDSVLYMGGKATVSSHNTGYLVKINADGDSLRAGTISNGGAEEQIRGIVPRSSGGALCVGWSGQSWNNRRAWMFSIDTDGTTEWQWLHGPNGSGFYGMIPVSSGGFLAFGQVNETNVRKGYALRLFFSRISGRVTDALTDNPVAGAKVGPVGFPFFVTTDENGEYNLPMVNGTYDISTWGSCISRTTVTGVTVAPDSTTTVDFQVLRPLYIQEISSLNAGAQNGVLNSVPLHIANDGTGTLELIVETETIAPASNWLAVSPDSAVIPSGESLDLNVLVTPDTTNDGTYDYVGRLFVYTNSCPGDSNMIPVMIQVLDVDDVPAITPQDFSLSVYPNPFNAETFLTFRLPHTTQVSLSIFDVNGRRISSLANQAFAAGEHRIAFDAQELASGLYFARLSSTDFNAAAKLVLLK